MNIEIFYYIEIVLKSEGLSNCSKFKPRPGNVNLFFTASTCFLLLCYRYFAVEMFLVFSTIKHEAKSQEKQSETN